MCLLVSKVGIYLCGMQKVESDEFQTLRGMKHFVISMQCADIVRWLIENITNKLDGHPTYLFMSLAEKEIKTKKINTR